jgi:hypothetical protein
MKNRTAGCEKLAGEMKFELKYCERCGGLWLRPAGGEQIYCTGCGREMAKLPAVSREVSASTLEGSVWSDDDLEIDEDGEDMGTVGGVA